MNRTRRLRLVLCTLLCFVLCSCQTVLPANEKAQVEELLRAPKLSGDYGALQTALNDWLGESAQLKYPIQGELLSPFVLQDLDGDGQQDAAVLYTTAQTANVCIAILQRDDAGSWQALPKRWRTSALLSCRIQTAASWWWAIPLPRMTTIWRCTLIRTALCPPFSSSSTSSIWWKISPAAAVRI